MKLELRNDTEVFGERFLNNFLSLVILTSPDSIFSEFPLFSLLLSSDSTGAEDESMMRTRQITLSITNVFI